MNEEQFKKLRREVEEAKTASDRAQGALTQLMTRLKEEFDCGDIESAKKLLADLKARKDKAEVSFDKAMRNYEKKWKNE